VCERERERESVCVKEESPSLYEQTSVLKREPKRKREKERERERKRERERH